MSAGATTAAAVVPAPATASYLNTLQTPSVNATGAIAQPAVPTVPATRSPTVPTGPASSTTTPDAISSASNTAHSSATAAEVMPAAASRSDQLPVQQGSIADSTPPPNSAREVIPAPHTQPTTAPVALSGAQPKATTSVTVPNQSISTTAPVSQDANTTAASATLQQPPSKPLTSQMNTKSAVTVSVAPAAENNKIIDGNGNDDVVMEDVQKEEDVGHDPSKDSDAAATASIGAAKRKKEIGNSIVLYDVIIFSKFIATQICR
tara:strand:- start:330 stop:1118 length:789 start_codon:yes stop_codon:yes gene_type:complete